jgi:hypothetical protein
VKQKETNYYDIEHGPQSSISAIAPGEVIIGTVVELDGEGRVLVDYHGNPLAEPLVAVSTLGITKKHIDRQVALLFANGNPQQPVIMGLIHNPLQEMLDAFEVTPSQPDSSDDERADAAVVDDVMIDGKRIVLEGREEIVLKCGEASITLTKAGKILIRGKYLLNRSTGVNRIMGGSVQVN